MEINFNPNKKQFKAWKYLTDNKTKEIGYGGAAASGKSFLGCFWIISMCLKHPGTAWVIGRRELTNLKKTTLVTFFKVTAQYGIESFKMDNQQNIIKFDNGSKVFLMDLSYQPSDPLFTRLGGLELTGAFVDESNEVEVDGIDILRTRIGRQKNEEFGITPKLLETFNPSKNHVHHRYYKPWKTKTLPKHRVFIQALPHDNKYVSKEYIEQLKNSDKITRERLLYGNFDYDDDSNCLVDFDAISDIFYTEADDKEHKYMTVDVARFGQDKTVIMVWQGWQVYKVITYSHKRITELAQIVRDLAVEDKVPFSHIIVDEDGVGGGLVDTLGGVKGFIANSTPLECPNAPKKQVFRNGEMKSITEKDNFRNLKSQCGYYLADKVNDRKIAVRNVDESTKDMIIEELGQLRSKDPEKEGKLQLSPKEEMKEALGRSPDYLDAMIMRLAFELGMKINNVEFVRVMDKNEQSYIEDPYD